MKIKNLRSWLDKLPSNYDESEIVFRTIKDTENDNDNWVALDTSIAACGIDEGSNEMYLCSKQSAEVIEKG